MIIIVGQEGLEMLLMSLNKCDQDKALENKEKLIQLL